MKKVCSSRDIMSSEPLSMTLNTCACEGNGQT